jgi:hypothetical protein
MERYVKATRTTKYGVTYSYEKRVPRDRSEWIGVNIPAIIPKELFDRVHTRIAHNRNRYRKAKRKQLLSRLVERGMCGSGFYSLPTVLHEEARGRPHEHSSQGRVQVQLAGLA